MKMTKRVKKDQDPTENLDDNNQQNNGNDDQATTSTQNNRPNQPSSTSSVSTKQPKQQNQNSKITSESTPIPVVVDHTITLREHMIKSLKQGDYECIICSNEIKTAHPIWSCSTCYRCYHIGCAKKWANKSIETANGAAASSSSASTGAADDSYFARQAALSSQFRCPSCNTMNNYPQQYKCFCAKVVDPKIDAFLTSHSCGEVCGKTRGNGCAHKCSIPCHPGPCPPCKFQAPEKPCPCGKTTYTHVCGTPDPRKTCDNVCDKLLNCGFHTCESKCHHGPCKPCDIKVKMPCHCSKVTKEVACGSATFSCEIVCAKTQRCGHCKCDFTCHGGNCPPCATDPAVIATCPCGKTPLPKDVVRTSCQDPIPTCDNRCGKVLPCGIHECEELCHEGPCPRCTAKRDASCPCGYNSQKKVRCFEARELACNKTCGATMSCGRHQCKQVCCPHRRNPDPTTVAVHRCNEICGRQLLCGHICTAPCHSGSCPVCPNWILEDLTCGCGAQYLPAPLPCGTKLPICHEPCPRGRDCGHNNLKHNCHYGDCPPCAEPIERSCAGGHVLKMKVQCSTDPETISCGKICGKQLPLCGHPCPRICHGGSCTAKATKKFCQARCDRLLPCSHRCQAKCHVNHGAGDEASALKKECPPCNNEVEIRCDCGIQTITFSCKDFLEWKERNPDRKTAPCNSNCSSKRKEAAVRPSKAADPTADYIHNPFIFSCKLWTAAKENPDFFCGVEKNFAALMKEKEGFKKLNPMNRERRSWAHELGWHYNIETESVDEEPKRAVLCSRTPATKQPSPLLSDAMYTGDEHGHNPFALLRDILSSRQKTRKSVIVFEGERLVYTALHKVLTPFMGKLVLVSGLEQLRNIPNLASDASTKFVRGGDEVNVVLAVFASTVTCEAAFNYLKNSMSKFVFHMFGQDAPPRNVEDSLGRLSLIRQNACAFVTGVVDGEKEDDNLWEDACTSKKNNNNNNGDDDESSGGAAGKKKKSDKSSKKSSTAGGADDWLAQAFAENGGDNNDGNGEGGKKTKKKSSDSNTPVIVQSVWNQGSAAATNAVATNNNNNNNSTTTASSTPGSWATMLKK